LRAPDVTQIQVTQGVNRTDAQQPITFNAHPLTNAALHFTFESTLIIKIKNKK
jgi:hypothetical protein